MIGLAIRRPVATAMAYVATALLGVVAWRNMPLELLPETELPRLTVRAEWPGSSPEAVEALIASPLEGAVRELPGVEKVRSTSEPGRATIRADFSRSTKMDFARLELSERIAALRRHLPDRVAPDVLPYVPRELEDRRKPFLEYTLTGPSTPEALRASVQDVIVPALTQIEGVGDVEVRGGRDRLLKIEVDPARAEGRGLSLSAVRQGVRALAPATEAGLIEEAGVRRTLAIHQGVESVIELLSLPLGGRGGEGVRLGDVARIHDTFEDARSRYRVDGLPAVSFTVRKRPGSNAVRLGDAVKARLAALAPSIPPDARLILDEDEGEAVRAQLSNLRTRAAVAVGMIFLVLLLFLGSIAAAVIVLATVGFSVLITVNLAYFAGLTLNVLTLMGLAMGFGLIVDNAIVVLENVFRRRMLGDAPAEAAARGAREVALPILAATLTTVVVLTPFVYLQGELQAYYVPLAVVVGLSLLASLVVAFTFIPAAASRLMAGIPARRRVAGLPGVARAHACRIRTADGRGTPPVDSRPPRCTRVHARLIGFTLRRPVLTVGAALALLGGSYHLFDRHVDRGVVWADWWGRDSYVEIDVRMPRGDDLERVDALTRQLEATLREVPGVDRFVTRVQPSFGTIHVTFADSLAGTGIPAAVKERLVGYSRQFDGLQVRVYGYGPSFYGDVGAPPAYSIHVLGYDYEEVREIAEDVGQRLARFSRIRDVDTNASGHRLREKETEMVLRIDRARLALHDLTVRDLVGQVAAATGSGASEAVVRVAGEDARVSVMLAGGGATAVQALQDLRLPTGSGSAVRLAAVAGFEERTTPGRIEREDQRYNRVVAYEFRGSSKLGDRTRDAVIASTFLPPGYTLQAGDAGRWSEEEQRQVHGILALSIALVFMVTASLFESLRQPAAVLLTVPMALVGVFLAFFFTRASFTREAYVGVILMAGIAVNNAILLVAHITHLRRADGIGLEAAVVRGTIERVRPILMTSATSIGGLLPLVAFSASADENIWNALAYVLIGGLASSTLFVLTVTPALYFLVERGPARRSG